MPNEIERRLRGAYAASDLLVDPVIADRTQRSAMTQRSAAGRPHRRRMARFALPLLATGVVLAIAGGTLLAINRSRSPHAASPATRSPASSKVTPPPALVRAKTHVALTANSVTELDQPVQWVLTTTHRWAAMANHSTPAASTTTEPAEAKIYIVQIRGSFVCGACKGFRPITGSVIILELPLTPNQQIGEGFSMGNVSYDLSALGTVHAFAGS
jgi:hypothetical protein